MEEKQINKNEKIFGGKPVTLDEINNNWWKGKFKIIKGKLRKINIIKKYNRIKRWLRLDIKK